MRDPEICGREVAWHRDVLAAVGEEGREGMEGGCVWSTGGLVRQDNGRCCVCGLGRVVEPVVVCRACGAVACRLCYEATAGMCVCKCRCRCKCGAQEDGKTLGEAVFGEEGKCVAAAVAELRRELEGIAAAAERVESGGVEEEARQQVLVWAMEGLGTLGSVEGGVSALEENRCVSWEAAEGAIRGAAERVQHIQDMLA